MVARRGREGDLPTRASGWWRASIAVGIGILLALGGCALIVGRAISDLGDRSGLDHAFDCIGADLTHHRFTPMVQAPDGRPPIWTTELDAAPTAPPVVVDGRVVVRTASGAITALDAASGASLWSIPLGASSPLGTDFAPVVDGDTAFLTDWDGTVHALDVTTGASRWSATLPVDAATSSTIPIPGRGNAFSDALARAPRGGAPLAVDARSVYVDGDDLVALDRATGGTQWSAPLGNAAADGYSLPVITGDEVVVGTWHRSAHRPRAVDAFDVATGARRWSAVGDGGAGAFAAPRVSAAPAGIVVTGFRTHSFAVLDAATGQELRLVDGGPFAPFGSVPMPMGTSILIRDTAVRAVDPATGTQVWRADARGPNTYDFGPAALTDDLVIAPGSDGRLHALDRAHGTEVWTIGSPRRHRCGATIAAPPAVTDTSLVVLSADHTVTALPR